MSRVGEVLFFRKSRFSDQIRFWSDFLVILDGFESQFGSQNDTKMGLKIDRNFDGFLDRSWKGFGAPREARARLGGVGTGPRRGVGER